MDLDVKLEVFGVPSDAWVAAWDVLCKRFRSASIFPLSFPLRSNPRLLPFLLQIPQLPPSLFRYPVSAFQDGTLTHPQKTYIRRPLAKRSNRLHDIRILPAADLCVFLANLVESVGGAG
jgi:hypothetical protein